MGEARTRCGDGPTPRLRNGLRRGPEAQASFGLENLALIIWHIEPQVCGAFRKALLEEAWPGGWTGAAEAEHSSRAGAQASI